MNPFKYVLFNMWDNSNNLQDGHKSFYRAFRLSIGSKDKYGRILNPLYVLENSIYFKWPKWLYTRWK